MTFGLHLSIILIFSWHSPWDVSVRLANPRESRNRSKLAERGQRGRCNVAPVSTTIPLCKIWLWIFGSFSNAFGLLDSNCQQIPLYLRYLFHTFLPRRRRSKVQFRVHTRLCSHPFCLVVSMRNVSFTNL